MKKKKTKSKSKKVVKRKSRAIKIPGCKFLADTKTHFNRIQVRSQSSGNLYIVSQTMKSGYWACSCFGFRRYQRCKHLTAIQPVIEGNKSGRMIRANRRG